MSIGSEAAASAAIHAPSDDMSQCGNAPLHLHAPAFIALLFLFVSTLLLVPSFVLAPDAFAREIPFSGSDRYETAAGITDTAAAVIGTPVQGVIVVSGENFPDALVASALSGLKGYPVLLTGCGVLPSSISSEIERLAPAEAIIIGGEKAVSSDVEGQVAALTTTGTVTRYSGDNRITTAEDVYARNTGWGKSVIVCSGNGFADATSISPYACANKDPVFLTDGSGDLQASTQALIAQAIGSGATSILICGGTSAVSQATQDWCSGVASTTRLGGDNRYQTSFKIAEWCVSHGMTYNYAAFASGTNFPDALVGGSLQGATNSVLLLVGDDTAGKYALRSIADSGHFPSTWRVFGGYSAVSDVIRFELNASADGAYADYGNAGVIAARYCLDHVGDEYSQANRWDDGVYDCSSLAYRSYSETAGQSGFDIASQAQFTADGEVHDIRYCAANEAWWCTLKNKTVSSSALKPGDWIFFGGSDNGRYQGIYHVAIYVGDGRIVQAEGDDEGVTFRGIDYSNIGIYGRAYK